MSLGPLMLGLLGPELSREEREILRHPLVGGVILFTRNYRDPGQLADLTGAVHALRSPRLLVGVDHEGGRVQRFRDGFTPLPAPRTLGRLYDQDRRRALERARVTGWLMAAELRAVGVDFSFAPVLDLDLGISRVIGERALHGEPGAVVALARAYIAGMYQAGMAAVGKHFPGHGSVTVDSHAALPVDARDYGAIAARDLIPFARLAAGGIAALMPAHVLYPRVDSRPAGFSRHWLQVVLRGELGFQGAIVSDDLDMQGAAAGGDPAHRAEAALAAGCDLVLACNDRQAALAMLHGLRDPADPAAHLRLTRLHGHGRPPAWQALRGGEAWRRAVALVTAPGGGPQADMNL